MKRTAVLGLLGLGLNACALLSKSTSDGPAEVDDLVGRIERVYVDAELAKERVHTALATLERIAAADFDDDAVTAYARLVEDIEASEEQAGQLRETVEPMKDSAGPVFSQWEKEAESIAGPTMRERSLARLEATRERYEAIVAAVDPALATLDEINRGLRDHALFLSHDFNAAALASIREDVAALAGLADGLDERLDEAMLASRTYVESNSLPAKSERREERVEKVSGSRTLR